MTKEIPKSKFKEGDKVRYKGSTYSIIKIHHNYYGWQYAIKANSVIKSVDLKVGDDKFSKA
jgi:translation elongation factor P/translation initiation factor 5A